MFNPFDHVNWEDRERAVEGLRARHPRWSNRRLCDEIISSKGNWMALSGGLTSLPGIIPGAGTVVTLVAGTSVDLVVLVKMLSELVAEICLVYGRRPTTATSREGFWVLCSAFGATMGGEALSKYVVMQASKRIMKRLVQRLLAAIGLRVTQKAIARYIPILGSAVMAMVNKQTANLAGAHAVKYFEANPVQEPGWDGPAEDGADDD